MPPAKRKRLQKMFEHASKQSGQEQYDYANDLFTECVVSDPVNLMYVQSFLDNLKKKYGNNKKGSSLAFIQGASTRRTVKKALGQEDWDGVIKAGCDALKLNPWDIPTLLSMAKATDRIGGNDPPIETPLHYLKCALEANSKDPEVNRECAKAMEERGQLDQAIHCWHRVEQALPNNEEAQRAIADLAVKKTLNKLDSTSPMKNRAASNAAASAEPEMTPEQRLERKIAQAPKELSNYLELAQLYINDDRFKEAEEVYARAFEASGGDQGIRDSWDDVQIRRLRHQLAGLQRRRETGDEQAKQEYRRLRKALIEKELEVYKGRVERFPNNLLFKYELGYRYMLAGQQGEAIKQFQLARNDPRRKGLCMLYLGQCFEQIGQNRLAIGQYESAIEEIPDRDGDHKKDALYRAGSLQVTLKNLDAAEKHLSVLAAMDFTYKDVSALLDKIGHLRDNPEDQDTPNGAT